jgi:hypothetical protein
MIRWTGYVACMDVKCIFLSYIYGHKQNKLLHSLKEYLILRDRQLIRYSALYQPQRLNSMILFGTYQFKLQ